jgi:hypothetical protein
LRRKAKGERQKVESSQGSQEEAAIEKFQPITSKLFSLGLPRLSKKKPFTFYLSPFFIIIT